jgi:pSer/pThr/pTyr-binding forkhead associated (FHA) protein
MDFLEKLNQRFGRWYEGLFGGAAEGGELRPRDVLRRLVAALEDGRREGLDGQVYVPNVITLTIAVSDDEERQYLSAFLSAQELAAAVADKIAQHGYRTRGPLIFSIVDVPAAAGVPRMAIACRFDTAAAPAAPETPDLKTVPAFAAGDASATLIALSPEGRLEEFGIGASGVSLGRGRQAGNDIVLGGDTMISRRHARIVFENGRFVVIDEGSANGTLVGGERLAPGVSLPLTDGDELVIGRTRLTFRTSLDPATAPAPSAPVWEPPAPGRAFRLVTAGGESYPLASTMLVGRALTDDIVLIGEGVAAQHARLCVRERGVTIEDLDTPGGTFVNGERLPPSFPVAVYPGDEVLFGSVVGRLVGGGAPG